MKANTQTLKSKIREHIGAVYILLAFVILAVVYSLATPPLEAGDESRHYAVVKYMADTGRLPVQDGGEAQIHWSHEGNQPPLYYALAAALTFWIDTGDWSDVFWYNPHTTIGDPLRPDNKNITIHRPNEAWQGHILAVHLIRFLSIGMAAVTVTAAYFIALHLFKDNRWLAAGAMAVTAFNPMFLFISAAVNNDNAVIMFVTLALLLMTRIAELNQNNSQFTIHNSQFTIHLSAALLGLLIGLGVLSKLYALGLLPLAGLLFLWLANDRRPPTADRQREFNVQRSTSNFFRLFASRLTSHALTWTAITLLVTLLVAGWFYWRNALLYGDPLALQVMRETAGQRHEAPTLSTLRTEFEGFRIAYWALFGGVNILADPWIYRVLDGVSLVAALGLVAFILRFTIYDLLRNSPTIYVSRITHHAFPVSLPTFAILLVWFGIMGLGFIVWNLTQPAGQGRLLYPAIAVISALAVWGLTWWLPASAQKIAIVVCTLALLIFAAVSPVFYIAYAYTKPPILTEKELPTDVQPLNFIYDGKIRLLGYQLHTPVVHPAETFSLTLYWQLLEPVDLNYSIFIHLLGRQRQVVGQLDTYPGGGQWPTTLLSPGAILADHYAIPISPEAETKHAPARLLIAAGIYDFNEPGRPGKPAVNTDGQPVEPIITSAKLIPWQWPTPPRFDPPINFADKVTLLSYEIAADRQSITLNWQVNAPLELDYTVFLQLWRAATDTGAEAQYVTGFDGPPVQGDFPISLWAAGDIVVDTHPLDLTTLSSGDYYLLAGLYNPATGERLPAATPTGPLPDYAVNLGSIKVVR